MSDAYEAAMRRTVAAVARAHAKVPAAKPHPKWWRRLLGQTYRTPTERIEAAHVFMAALCDERERLR